MNKDRKKELFGIQCDEIDMLENRITVLERLVELQKQEIALIKNNKVFPYQPDCWQYNWIIYPVKVINENT